MIVLMRETLVTVRQQSCFIAIWDRGRDVWNVSAAEFVRATVFMRNATEYKANLTCVLHLTAHLTLIIFTRHNVHKHVSLVLQSFTHHGDVGMNTISQVTNPAYTLFGGDADTVKEQGELHGVPLMMLANKQDLPEAISTADISVQFDMHKITKVAFRLQPCSGLTW